MEPNAIELYEHTDRRAQLFFDSWETPPLLALGIFGRDAKQLRQPLDPRAFRLHGHGEINGRRHLLIRTAPPREGSKSFKDIWVNTERGNTIARVVHFTGDRERYRVDIQYMKQSGGLFPVAWSSSRPGYGIQTITTVDVDVNPSFDNVEFHVEPRDGMVVNLVKSGKVVVWRGSEEASHLRSSVFNKD